MVSVTNSGSATPSDAHAQPALQPIINVTKERVQRPWVAPEVELVGRVQDSAFDDEQWLICYEDTYIQATPLLYHVLLYSDGTRTTQEIADEVARATGIELTGDDVEWLVMNRLIPSGLLDLGVEDEEGPRPAEVPVLGIRWRIPLFPYEWTVPIADLFKFLYWPPLMAVVFVAAVAINVWIFVDATVIASAQALLFRPEFILLIFALDLVSTLFHEIGHASALRRAGVRYGWIGFALYVIFPVFYTDVTHVYRLNRRDKIRVDLGGMYFELVMTVVFFWLYLVTGSGIFLIAIVLTTMSFLQQFTPFLRFDGYYTIADIMGVHEPLSIVKPFLRDQIPWPRNRTKSLPSMRTGPRIAFIVYLLAIVAFLSYPLFIGAFAGRQFARALFDSGSFLWSQMINAWSQGEILFGIVATLQLIFWALIPLGITLFAFTLIRHFGMAGIAIARALRNWLFPGFSVSRPLRMVLVSVAVLVMFLAFGANAAVNTDLSLPWGSQSQRDTSDPDGGTAPAVVEPSSSAAATEDESDESNDSDAAAEPPASEDDTTLQSDEPVAVDEPAPPEEFDAEAIALPDDPPTVEPAMPSIEPVEPEPVIHVVEQGESLWIIAEKYETSLGELIALNDIRDPNIIHEGQVLEIP